MLRVLACAVCVGLLGSAACDILYGPCKNDGITYRAGQTWSSMTPCEQYVCHADKTGDTFVEVQKCANYTVHDPCFLKIYPYKAYPDCCPTPACPPTKVKDNDIGDGGYIWNKFGHGRR